jgi:LysM repeat protein
MRFNTIPPAWHYINREAFTMEEVKIYSNTGILINLTVKRLYYNSSQAEKKDYPVAVGKPSTPTPTGAYKIITKIVNPGGVLGTRWMGLDIPDGPYGIHGTNNPASIGKEISNGCIRMYNNDVEELFNMVKIGTIVTIIKSGMPTGEGTFTVYVVRPGDTLFKIARRFGVTVDELVEINKIPDANVIYPGQELKIPRK